VTPTLPFGAASSPPATESHEIMSQQKPAKAKDLIMTSTMDLCARANDGCSESLNLLIRRHLAPLANWARGRLPLRSRELMDTEDIVQEVLIGTVKQLPNIEQRGPGTMRAYLRQAVLNRIRSELRRTASRPQRSDELESVADANPSPLENLVGADALRQYEEALAGLSHTDRELVIARVELRQTYVEIARDHDKSSPDAARMAVSRALLKLAGGMHCEE